MIIGLLAPGVRDVGGVQSYMRRLLEVVGDLGKEENSTFCISVNDAYESTSMLGGVSIYGAGRSKARFILLTLKHARKTDYLLVGHIGQAPVAWLMKKLGLIYHFGVILHGIEAWERLPLMKRLALRNADDVIATTQHTAEVCTDKNGLKNSKLSVIPLCVEASSAEPSDFKLTGNFKILCVGRQAKTEEGKGYHMLFDAMRQLKEEYPGAHLNMVGDGGDQGRLIELSTAQGLKNQITFWGRLSHTDLQAAYRNCDVFAMPSKKEGFGIVFLEAMRSGKPCIGGNHGGTPEVIVEGQSGFLVDFDDVETLVRRLNQLMTSPKLCTELGNFGAELVQTRYSFESFCHRFRCLLSDSNQALQSNA